MLEFQQLRIYLVTTTSKRASEGHKGTRFGRVPRWRVRLVLPAMAGVMIKASSCWSRGASGYREIE